MAPGVVVREPGTQLQPDVMVYRAAGPLTPSWNELREIWLAVEVLSPSSRVYDREFKRDAYLTLGVAEVWLVDLAERAVLVSRPGRPVDERVTGVLPWESPHLDTPIAFDLSRLFAGLA